MLKDQCISVTDLRNNTKQCLDGLSKEPKYVFINNKPVAVLMNVVAYEENFVKPELIELQQNEVDSKLKKEAEEALHTDKSDLMDV